MKKLYSCKHQKEAINPCSICSEERINYLCGSCQWHGKKKELSSKGNCPKCDNMVGEINSASEQRSSCNKCGKKIKSGELQSPYDDNEHNEKWVEAHDCQPNSEKVKQKDKQETEKDIPTIEEDKSNKRFHISCKDCNFSMSWNYEGSESETYEEAKKKAKELLTKFWQNHQQSFHSSTNQRERERESWPRREFSWRR
ncbi:hypothetical protein GvMRE_I2g607 [endosymbiont GvMRE of Glomus versiforme]|nr:hypothetical protein GvMRE_I2g607 [endosymbiont GvMRE of Glomus versiforme]